MHKFSDFATDDEHMEGAKKSIQEIVGKQIFIWNARVMQSQYGADECVMFQFSFEENGDKFVVFTASKVLLEQLEKYKTQMPFEATVEQRKSGKHFYFTLT